MANISVGFVTKSAVMTINATGLDLVGTLKIAINVDTDLALGGVQNDAELHFLLKGKDSTLSGNIDKETLGTVTEFQTTLDVDSKTLEAHL